MHDFEDAMMGIVIQIFLFLFSLTFYFLYFKNQSTIIQVCGYFKQLTIIELHSV